jgi:type 1 glutamine amidotransferase
MRRALVVRGGWDGHSPREATELFLPFLKEHGFEVEVSEDLAVYLDAARLAATDLVVQCWSMGEISDEQAHGLAGAVRAGTGFAGWHGGIVAAFEALPYLHLTGGRFVYHPPGFVDHELTVVPGQRGHPIVTGIDRVSLHTEKYWVLTDPLCDVLATVTFPPDHPGDDRRGDTAWRREVTLPAVWTRRWGTGRVFVSTVGHRPADLRVPEVRALTERGLLWAARQPVQM